MDLNAHLGESVPMTRFRPNLVTAGGAPWAEDSWDAFQIAGPGRKALAFASVKPCSRCKVGAGGQTLECWGWVQGLGRFLLHLIRVLCEEGAQFLARIPGNGK